MSQKKRIFLKAIIGDQVDDYEVYDSSGEAVTKQGDVKRINIEVKNRVFFQVSYPDSMDRVIWNTILIIPWEL